MHDVLFLKASSNTQQTQGKGRGGVSLLSPQVFLHCILLEGEEVVQAGTLQQQFYATLNS
jgi:hypothetical protein